MNIPSKFWTAVITVLGLLTAFLAIVSIKEVKSWRYVGVNTTVTNTITVDGTGEAVATPDIATFSFTVSETAKTVAQAQALATEKSNAALKAVRAGGVADKDIQTIAYNINPHYEYSGGVCTANYCPPSKQVLTGYDVSQTTQVKIRDLSKAGDLFTSIGSIGVQNVNGLSFAVDKPEAVKAQARAKAIAEAQSKADELARQLHVTLVRIVSFSESDNSPRPMMYAMGGKAMAADSAPAAPEISTGEQKITDNVQITYEIK